MQPAFISHYPDQNPRFHCGPPSRQRVALGRTKVRTSLHTHLSCASICFQRFLFFFFLSWQLGLSRHRHNCQRQLLVKDRRRVIFFISRSLSLSLLSFQLSLFPIFVFSLTVPLCSFKVFLRCFHALSRRFSDLLRNPDKSRGLTKICFIKVLTKRRRKKNVTSAQVRCCLFWYEASGLKCSRGFRTGSRFSFSVHKGFPAAQYQFRDCDASFSLPRPLPFFFFLAFFFSSFEWSCFRSR